MEGAFVKGKVILTVFVRVNIAVMKHHDEKQLGEERAYIFTWLFTTEGKQDRNSHRAGPGGRG